MASHTAKYKGIFKREEGEAATRIRTPLSMVAGTAMSSNSIAMATQGDLTMLRNHVLRGD
jgi:hypothetical protein